MRDIFPTGLQRLSASVVLGADYRGHVVMTTPSNGKGTKDFEAYVRNLQRALWLTSIGAQLSTENGPKIRGPMVHNPYSRTIAELNICLIRS